MEILTAFTFVFSFAAFVVSTITCIALICDMLD